MLKDYTDLHNFYFSTLNGDFYVFYFVVKYIGK